MSSYSIESFLANELNIRFLDAIHIVSEAKIILGIPVGGYLTEDGEGELKEKAIKIFHQKSELSQARMGRPSSSAAVAMRKRLRTDFLEAFRNPAGTIFDSSEKSSSWPDSFASKKASASMWQVVVYGTPTTSLL
jgi:hypothetical protein